MKKVFMFLLAAGILGVVACGPSAEQKAQDEANAQAAADSLMKAAEAATAAAPAADTTAKAAEAPATEQPAAAEHGK